MPERLAQQEDENKVGRAILRASPGQLRLLSQRAQSARSTFALRGFSEQNLRIKARGEDELQTRKGGRRR
jgi:hypothetical protein